MGFLSGAGKNNSPTIASNLTLQSSVYGYPIPIVYGSTRVGANLIWYGDFVATAVSEGKGGKGTIAGGGGKSGGGQYQYQVAVAMALCEGPIVGVSNVYVDKSVTNYGSLGFTEFTGLYPQDPWGFLVGQEQVTVEQYAIPGSPYQITVNQAASFYQAGAVNEGGSAYTRLPYGDPGPGQYVIQLSGEAAFYYFNAAQAGQGVYISYSTVDGGPGQINATVPASSPYMVTVPGGDSYQDLGVVEATIVFTQVSGSPGLNEFSVLSGVYTFNAANAGQNIQIDYYTYQGTQALGYNGIAYLGASAYQLGESAALPNHNFEVFGVFSQQVPQQNVGEQDTIPGYPYQITVEFAVDFVSDDGVTDIAGNPFTAVQSNPGNYQYSVSGGVYTFSSINSGIEVNITYSANVGYDADPSLIVPDLLSNEHYGAGFPSGNVGNLSAYQAYCIANGLLISPCYNQQQPVSQILQDIATATNSAFVWSEGVLNLVPYGDEEVSAFGYTYTPPSEPVFSFDDDYFMKNQNPTGTSAAVMNYDPVILSRKRPADQINSIKLEVLDRNNDYNVAVIEAKDQALIENFGLRQSASSNSHLFCNIAAARQSAQLQLQRQAIMNIYSFQLDQRFVWLDPMDIVSITDSGLGLSNQWVRIREITENDDGSLSITAEEYLTGTGSAAAYNFQFGMGYGQNYNVAPGNVNTPVIFEPTDALGGGLQVWLAVSGINKPLWGGCDVYLSTDGTNYANVGRIKGAARQGVLSASLASVTQSPTGQTIDQTNTLSVSLLESGGQLNSGSQSDATNLNTVCYVDGEIIAYETSTLTGTNAYALTYLVRGCYDTPIGSHGAGSAFARLDSAIFEYDYAAALIGTTILVKFVSFNIWGGGAQTLADVEPYTYTLQGSAYTSALPDVTGLAPAYTGYVAGTTQLLWNAVSDFRSPIDYEVRQGTTWANGNVLYRTPLLQGPIAGDGTYWVAAHFKVPNGGPDVYSETPASLTVVGSQTTQNVLISYTDQPYVAEGTLTNLVVSSLGLQLAPAGNILVVADYLGTPDVLYYGGSVASGTWEFDNVYRFAQAQLFQFIVNLTGAVGYSLNAVNILGITDYLNASNILGVDLGNNTSAIAQVALSQDGTTFGAWQNWIPGTYFAQTFNFRLLLETAAPSVLAVITDVQITVDAPDIVQSDSLVGRFSHFVTILRRTSVYFQEKGIAVLA